MGTPIYPVVFAAPFLHLPQVPRTFAVEEFRRLGQRALRAQVPVDFKGRESPSRFAFLTLIGADTKSPLNHRYPSRFHSLRSNNTQSSVWYIPATARRSKGMLRAHPGRYIVTPALPCGRRASWWVPSRTSGGAFSPWGL